MTHLLKDTIQGSKWSAEEVWGSIKEFKKRVSQVMVWKILKGSNQDGWAV